MRPVFSLIILLSLYFSNGLYGQSLLPERSVWHENKQPRVFNRKISQAIVKVILPKPDDYPRANGYAARESHKAFRALLKAKDQPQSGMGFLYLYKGQTYVVTNAHVIANSVSGEIEVEVAGRKSPVSLEGWDTFYDLAVLRLHNQALATRIPKLEFSTLIPKNGLPVYAYVSKAKQDNDLLLSGQIQTQSEQANGISGNFNHIQSSLDLFPGCSGSPMLDQDGKVLGINTRIIIRQQDTSTLTIDAIKAKRLVEKLIKSNDTKLERVFLGIEFSQLMQADPNSFDPEDANLPYISSLQKTSPSISYASEFEGKIVEEINGRAIHKLEDILHILEALLPNSRLILSLRTPFSNEVQKYDVSTRAWTKDIQAELAVHFISKYAGLNASNLKDAQKIALKGKPKPENTYVYPPDIQSNTIFDAIAAGLQHSDMSQHDIYRTESLSDLGILVRLCALSGNLSLWGSGENRPELNIYLKNSKNEKIRSLFY